MNTRNRIKTVLTLAAVAMAILVLATTSANANVTDLIAALTALEDHIDGTTPLDAGEIAAHKATIDSNRYRMGDNSTVIAASFDLVAAYDNTPGYGPLWIARGQFDRRIVTDDIHWTIYNVMQYIMDDTYTTANISSHESLIDGFKFESSAGFPGAVDPPANPDETHTATINGSFPKTYGHDTMHWTWPARKPTGTYLAPGTIATITVPPSLAGKGYQVRVGAQSWDMSNRPWVRRLDRSSLLYSINSTQVKVASPLGGGIYIEVPYLADAGIVDVQIKNAVRSPYFSAKSFHSTSLTEWLNTERNHPAPWADFQSDKFMMQVPTSWIYKLQDPVTLMQDWDAAMDATNDLMGFPHIRGKETMYPQVDVIFHASAYAPGYPSTNINYTPGHDYGGYHSHHLVRGPQYASYYEFHEQGHAYLFVKFPGEVESNVNLLHVPVWHRKFGYSLDVAFRNSMDTGNLEYRTLDTAAVCWMMCQNFKNNREMERLEKQYQLKGHAKFVEIARLFGWEALGNFWYSINVDYENGIYWSRHGSNIDDLILRWSGSVGVDITPLFHFWGVHPINANSLKAAIAAENIPASAEIYDTLVKYQSLVPADKNTYQDFAYNWWEREPRSTGYMTEQDHALLWDTYDGAYAAIIKTNVQNIIDLYFPGGRPSTDAGIDMITWSDQPVQLDPNVIPDLTYAWSANPDDGVVFSDPTALAPTVTITKAAAGDAVTVTLTLTVDGETGLQEDTMTIDVYDDACKAAIGKGLAADNPADFDGNCITNFKDLAVMATKWLVDNALTEPAPVPQ